jgi:two-component system, LytTR family, response regulator
MKTKVKALIVDDEENSRKVLLKLLTKFCPEVEIIGEAENVDEAYGLCLSKEPNLVFLDVQMATGNGFELLKKFSEVPFKVIFVTGYDKYAINAIKFSALDYLLKPVMVESLVEAVKKAMTKINDTENRQTQIINLLYNVDASEVEKKITVHHNEKVMLIKIDAICFIQASGRYSTIHTKEKEEYTLTKTLKEFEEFFSNNSSFIRLSKDSIININYIKKYTKGEPCIIEMFNDKTFEVSRRKKQEVLEKLKIGKV